MSDLATAILDSPPAASSQRVVFLSDFLDLSPPRLTHICMSRVRKGDDASHFAKWTKRNRLQAKYYAKKVARGSEALQDALEVAYGRSVSLSGEMVFDYDVLPPVRQTLDGQPVEPLVIRREKTGIPKEITQDIPPSKSRRTYPLEDFVLGRDDYSLLDSQNKRVVYKCERPPERIRLEQFKWHQEPVEDLSCINENTQEQISLEPKEFLIKSDILTKKVVVSLRKWIEDQSHSNSDPNLFYDLRYARDKIQHVPRNANAKLSFQEVAPTSRYSQGSMVKKTNVKVYAAAGENFGDTARPAEVHRAERPFGSEVRWVRLSEKTIEHFPNNDVGDLVGVISYRTSSAHAQAWRQYLSLEVGTWAQQVHALVKILFPEARLERLSKGDEEKFFTQEQERVSKDMSEFEAEARKCFEQQRQFDSLGAPLYFPQFIDGDAEWFRAQHHPDIAIPRGYVWEGKWANVRSVMKPSVFRMVKKRVALPPLPCAGRWLIHASCVDDISAVDLAELKEIWAEVLKDKGLAPCPLRQFPIHTLLKGTQSEEDPTAIADRVREYASPEEANEVTGFRAAKKIEMLMEAIMGRMTSKEAAEKFDTTPEAFRQAKSRALKRPILGIDERWYQASKNIKNKTNGLYALVKLPHQRPTMYFIMPATSAEKIRKEVLAANGDLSKAPYSLVRLEQARQDAAAQVRGGKRGRSRQAIFDAFQNAPFKIWYF